MKLGIKLDNEFYNTVGNTAEWYAYIRLLDIENMQRTIRCIDEGYLPKGAYRFFLEFRWEQRNLHFELLQQANKLNQV